MSPKKIILSLLVASTLLGVVTRLINLDKRQFHHDESQHATFSLSWAENPEDTHYKYSPAYHGPFLYYLTSKVFRVFGKGLWSARSIPLVLGIFLVFSPLFWRKYIGDWPAVVAVSLLACSPIMTYFSSFLAHDFVCLTLIFMILWGVLRLKQAGEIRFFIELFLIGFFFGLLSATKLIGFIYFILCLGLLSFWILITKKPIHIQKPNKLFVGFFLLFTGYLISYVYIQSSSLYNVKAAWSGLLGEGLKYWWSQHEVDRIKGSIWFHFRNLTLYEPLVTTILTLTIVSFLGRFLNFKRNLHIFARFSLFLCAGIFVCLFLDTFHHEFYFKLFKLTKQSHIFVYIISAFAGLFIAYVVYQYNQVQGLLWYFLGANLAVFSYVGEKVPWLSVYIVYFAVIVGSIYLVKIVQLVHHSKSRWLRIAFLTVCCLLVFLQLRTFYIVSYETSGTGRDLLDQVHNSKYPRYLVYSMHQNPGKRYSILAVGPEMSWSVYFYLRQATNIGWSNTASAFNGTQDILLLDGEAKKKLTKKIDRKIYKEKEFPLSMWWTPYYMKISFGEWLHYFWHRTLKKGYGERAMYVFYKYNIDEKIDFNPSPEKLQRMRLPDDT